MLPFNGFAATSAALAGPHIGDAVHGDNAVEAHAYAAEQSARALVRARGTPVEDIVGEQDAGDGLSEDATVGAPVEFDRDL